MNITAIVQARMGSQRLPQKTLMDVCGKPMLGHVVERLRRSNAVTRIVIATSVNEADLPIVQYARQEGVTCFAGSEDDVLSRFVGAAKSVQTDLIVRITGDCPLIDPNVLDEMIAYHLAEGVEYTGNLARRTLPRGLDAEVFSVDALFKADKLGLEHHHREHVTPFIYEHPELFTIASFELTGALRRPDLRLCVDTQEDMQLIQRIYQEFYRPGNIVDMQAVIAWLDANPEWKYFNQAAELEHLRRNQMDGVRQVFVEPVAVQG